VSAEHHVDGETLRLRERPGGTSNGPHIVLAHGFEENWDTWLPLAAELPADLRVSALDLPWRAGSDYAWAEHGSSTVWLERALHLPAEPPTALVAHSFGASSLLELLTRRSPVAQVPATLVAPVFRPHDRAVDPHFFGEAVTRFRRVLGEGMTVAMGPRAKRLDAELLELMNGRIRERVEPHGFLQLYSMLARSSELPLEQVTVPVQLISGIGDASAPPDAIEVLRASLLDLTIHQTSELGHFCQVEQAAEVAEEVLSFLAALGIACDTAPDDVDALDIRLEEAMIA
jgi:pimeloyl-ACP methyl ester carboxylesterase